VILKKSLLITIIKLQRKAVATIDLLVEYNELIVSVR